MLGELNASEIERLLHQNMIGRIGCHAFGKTYIVPITYVYEGNAVYAHSDEGMKLHMMRENPHVAFEVDSMGETGNWESVIANGTFQEIAGDEARRALSLAYRRAFGSP
jgi:nitroimidazol reductase NimA-like FMN-containing flavoprotein (pyridoxamine 5'-phosphate oxidase superfamily)